jgi:hypothetical protein
VSVDARQPIQSCVEVRQGEAVAQRPEYVLGVLAIGAVPSEFGAERRGFEDDRLHRADGRVGAGLVERDAALRVHGAGAEADRGPVSFTDGTHAHDEPGAPCSHALLIGVEHHAGVAQRGTLDRELVREGGPEQQPSGR